MLHPFGGVVGECICAYALTAQNVGYVVSWGTGQSFYVHSALFPGYVSTGSLVRVDYVIDEYIGGTLNSSTSGTLNAGDPTAIINYPSQEATYLLSTTYTFDDGAVIFVRTPFEIRTGGAVTNVAWKQIGLLFHTCRNMGLSVDAFTVNGSARSTNPRWENGSTVQAGTIWSGIIEGTAPNSYIAFYGGMDVSEWTDIPPTFAGGLVLASCKMIDCVS